MKKLFAALIFLLLLVGRADAAFYANYFTTNANPVAGGGIAGSTNFTFNIFGVGNDLYTNSTPYGAFVTATAVMSGSNQVSCMVTNPDLTLFKHTPYNFPLNQFSGNAVSNSWQFYVPPYGIYRVFTNGLFSATAVGRERLITYIATNGASGSGGGGSGTTYTNNSGDAGFIVGSGIGTNVPAAQVAAIMATNPASVYYTSANGLTSDTSYATLTNDTPTSFGTDQQVALQTLLDKATNGALKLIINGIYTTGGLKVRANTWIETLPGCGLVLATSNNVPLLRNYNSSSNTISDENIKLTGGIFNFNGYKQAHDVGNSNGYLGGWITGMEFIGVRNLIIRDALLLNPSTFSFYGMNLFNFMSDNTEIDCGAAGPINRDGWHFNAPAANLKITNTKMRTGDDAFGINANEPIAGLPNYTPFYQPIGYITNVFIQNVTYNQCFGAFRILSSGSLITDVTIDNTHGTLLTRIGTIDNYLENPSQMSPVGSGNFGSIAIKNFKSEVVGPYSDYHYGYLDVQNSVVTNLSLLNWERALFSTNTSGSLSGLNVAYIFIDGGSIKGTLDISGWQTVSDNISAGTNQLFINQPVGTLRMVNNDLRCTVTNVAGVPVYIGPSAIITNLDIPWNMNTYSGYTNFLGFNATSSFQNDLRDLPEIAQLRSVTAGVTITDVFTNYATAFVRGNMTANSAIGTITNYSKGIYSVRLMANNNTISQMIVQTNRVTTTVKCVTASGFGTHYAEYVGEFAAGTEFRAVIDAPATINDYQLTLQRIK
jgi:hypothetical protein